MPRKVLLRRQPYTISSNNKEQKNMRIVLNPDCGLEIGDKVYQIKRKDGVIELVPESQMQLDKYI